MNARIHLSNGKFYFSNWPDQLDSLVTLILHPSVAELAKREIEIEALQVERLAQFLASKGCTVVQEISDTGKLARITDWSKKLHEKAKDFDDDLVTKMLAAMNIQFRDVQKGAIRKILASHMALVAKGCGAGKTLTSLSVVELLKRRHKKVFAVVALPSACATEYGKELSKNRGAFTLTLDEALGTDTYENLCKVELSASDIIVVSIDSIHMYVDAIRERVGRFDGHAVLIVDEGHGIKNVLSRRSKAAQEIAPHFDRLIISTATPMPQGPKDIRGYLATVGLPQPVDLYKSGVPDRDMSLLEGITFVSDESDLPFAPVQKRVFDFSTETELVDMMRAQIQRELDAGRKALVFCASNRAVDLIYREFSGVGRTVLSGTYSVTDCSDERLIEERNVALQERAKEQFNHDPRCRLMIANYRVGSTGLNLQHSGARLVFFFEIPNSGADFFQSEYRVRRPMVFPDGDFEYIYAVPKDAKRRSRAQRQFEKLENQRTFLSQMKYQTRRALEHV